MAILTNGNCDFHLSHQTSGPRGSNYLGRYLDSYMKLILSATDIGAAKPSPIGFLASYQLLSKFFKDQSLQESTSTGLSISRVLYVGDSYKHDVVGANRVGMKTAYLSRPNEISPTNAIGGANISTSPSHANQNISANDSLVDLLLHSLDTSHVEQKIQEYHLRNPSA